VGHRSSNGGPKFSSRTPRTEAGSRGFSFLLFGTSCPSNQFALFGKPYALTKDNSNDPAGVAPLLESGDKFRQRFSDRLFAL
jgi:hypothetical protein